MPVDGAVSVDDMAHHDSVAQVGHLAGGTAEATNWSVSQWERTHTRERLFERRQHKQAVHKQARKERGE